MKEDKEGPRKESKDLCRKLLESSQDVPESSRFSDSVFRSTCQRVREQNEAKVIDKIARLIVPSAEDLADTGSKHLEHLVESIDDGWENAIPVTKSRPQPDYAVGFGLEAFTGEQMKKLDPWVGEVTKTSFFMATYGVLHALPLLHLRSEVRSRGARHRGPTECARHDACRQGSR